MRTLTAAAAAIVLMTGVGACGTRSAPSQPEAKASGGDLFGSCKANDPVLDRARVLAEADVDGSGARNKISLVPGDAGGPCANALVTTFDGDPSAMSLGDATLDPGSAKVVRLSGTARQLLFVAGRSRARGGFQPHLFGGARGGQLGEVKLHGRPLLGFLASDGDGLPETATCTRDGGIAVLSATMHEPPGVVLAWDVRRTTYALDGTVAKRTSSKRIREAVADPTLRKQMPQLFDLTGSFADCS